MYVRVRVRVRTIFLSVDPGIELGLTVFVTSDFEKVPPDQLCPSSKRD